MRLFMSYANDFKEGYHWEGLFGSGQAIAESVNCGLKMDKIKIGVNRNKFRKNSIYNSIFEIEIKKGSG